MPQRGRKWDLVGKRRLWFLISGTAILVGLVFWQQNGLNYGIDFTGGGLLSYRLPEPVAAGKQAAVISEVRSRLRAAGITGARGTRLRREIERGGEHGLPEAPPLPEGWGQGWGQGSLDSASRIASL